jgi:hypothetical protein
MAESVTQRAPTGREGVPEVLHLLIGELVDHGSLELLDSRL